MFALLAIQPLTVVQQYKQQDHAESKGGGCPKCF